MMVSIDVHMPDGKVRHEAIDLNDLHMIYIVIDGQEHRAIFPSEREAINFNQAVSKFIGVIRND